MSWRQTWPVVAWSLALLLAMALGVWGLRWEPKLSFALERAHFYLETPAERSDGTLESPTINCSVKARFTNDGGARVAVDVQDLSAVEWDPPGAELEMGADVSGSSPSAWLALDPGVRGIRMGFRHVPEGARQVRFRFRVTAYRPSRWKDWMQRHLTAAGVPAWVTAAFSSRESRLIDSPWYEAEVPAAVDLRATNESATGAPLPRARL